MLSVSVRWHMGLLRCIKHGLLLSHSHPTLSHSFPNPYTPSSHFILPYPPWGCTWHNAWGGWCQRVRVFFHGSPLRILACCLVKQETEVLPDQTLLQLVEDAECGRKNTHYLEFFLALAICNTVVVSTKDAQRQRVREVVVLTLPLLQRTVLCSHGLSHGTKTALMSKKIALIAHHAQWLLLGAEYTCLQPWCPPDIIMACMTNPTLPTSKQLSAAMKYEVI